MEDMQDHKKGMKRAETMEDDIKFEKYGYNNILNSNRFSQQPNY